MGFVDDYIADVWDQNKLVPQYPPAGRVSVGDVLEKKDGLWQLRSKITSAGFKPKRQRFAVGPMSLESKGNKTLRAKAEGKTPSGVFSSVLGKADAGVAVTFTGRFGYVMSLADVTKVEMTNVDELVAFIRRRKFWGWDISQWLVVTTVYNARSASILTTGTQGATAVLRAAAALKSGPVKVADLSVGFQYAGGTSIQDKFVCESSFTPLYRARRITLRELIFGGLGPRRDEVVKGRALTSFIQANTGLQGVSAMTVEDEEFDPTAS